jgi:hypothetical protein
MISSDAITKILGIEEKVILSPEDMAKNLKVTFFPILGKNINENVRSFSEVLKEAMLELGVKIFDYDDCLETVPLFKRFRRVVYIILNNVNFLIKKFTGLKNDEYYIPLSSIRRIIRKERLKKDFCVIALGELDADFLPMQFISSFKHNSIVHILQFPDDINQNTNFHQHYQKAMSLFSYHMANIVVSVDSDKWMLYNFNASHPIFKRDLKDFKDDILNSLIPKIYAPISPNKLSEFLIKSERFDVDEGLERAAINELKMGATLFDKTGLFPEGKKIKDLPFRDNFHKFIGKLHLDNRNGMSFGFIAKQIPTNLERLVPINENIKKISNGKDFYYDSDKQLSIILNMGELGIFSMRVPSVWVMTLRSGSNKTRFDAKSDTLKIGLSNGKMLMQFPRGVKINGDYKPSFDTKVILAHAVGNSIIASILDHFRKTSPFIQTFSNQGVSIVHWHGYMNSAILPLGLISYGHKNPHVACSSPQSAVYALEGKLEKFFEIFKTDLIYSGDIHVEPHHGINVSSPSSIDLANFILENPNSTELGNKFLIK